MRSKHALSRAFARNYCRLDSLGYSGLRGEGSIPVPLPPPAWAGSCILRVSLLAFKPSSSNDFSFELRTPNRQSLDQAVVRSIERMNVDNRPVATLANPATSQAAIDGDYLLTCTAAAANAGTFSVQTPDGREIGPLIVGVAFSKEIKLTIADGATDFIVGDSFIARVGIANPAGYLFAALNPAATDGTQKAAGISIYRVVTTVGSTVKSPIIIRNALVAGKSLTWPAGITADQQAEATEQLRKLGIIIR